MEEAYKPSPAAMARAAAAREKMSSKAQKKYAEKTGQSTAVSATQAKKSTVDTAKEKARSTMSLKAYGATKGTKVGEIGGEKAAGPRDTIAPMTKDQHSKVQVAKKAAGVTSKADRMALIAKAARKSKERFDVPTEDPEDRDYEDELSAVGRSGRRSYSESSIINPNPAPAGQVAAPKQFLNKRMKTIHLRKEETQIAEEHAEGTKVRSTVDAQGLKKDSTYTVTKVDRKTTPFGTLTTHHVKGEDGKEHAVVNGHMLLRPIKEEAEQIDELSRDKLSKYLKAAGKTVGATNKQYVAYRKAKSRLAGKYYPKNAKSNPETGEIYPEKYGMKEKIEMSESNVTQHRKFLDSYSTELSYGESGEEHHNQLKKKYGAKAANHMRAAAKSVANGNPKKAQIHYKMFKDSIKNMNESAEQIDEISKKLAGNYLYASIKDQLKKHGLQSNMYGRLQGKRKLGADRAMKRLKNEEVEQHKVGDLISYLHPRLNDHLYGRVQSVADDHIVMKSHSQTWKIPKDKVLKADEKRVAKYRYESVNEASAGPDAKEGKVTSVNKTVRGHKLTVTANGKPVHFVDSRTTHTFTRKPKNVGDTVKLKWVDNLGYHKLDEEQMKTGNKHNKTDALSVAVATAIAKRMGGDMTKAVGSIEKFRKNLSTHPRVKTALQAANEEAEQIDELKKSTLRSYAAKSKKGDKIALALTKASGKPPFPGMKAAKVYAKEEAEQVDEVNARFDPEAAATPKSSDVKNWLQRNANKRAKAASKKFIRRQQKIGGLGPDANKKDYEQHMSAHFEETELTEASVSDLIHYTKSVTGKPNLGDHEVQNVRGKSAQHYSDKGGFGRAHHDAIKHKGRWYLTGDYYVAEETEVDETNYIEERLTKSNPPSQWISDFVKSDNPKFAGKSKKERINMALGAYYGAKRAKTKNEEVEQVDESSHEGRTPETEKERQLAAHHGNPKKITYGDVVKARIKSGKK